MSKKKPFTIIQPKIEGYAKKRVKLLEDYFYKIDSLGLDDVVKKGFKFDFAKEGMEIEL